jgi:hypothetical protein
MSMTQLYFHEPFFKAETDYRRELLARAYGKRGGRRHWVRRRRSLKALRPRPRPVAVA